MSDIKCGTFGGVDIPPDIRERMNRDRARAEQTLLRYDDAAATREAAWQVLRRAGIKRGQHHLVVGPVIKAAFDAGWGAHKDAMARVAKLSKGGGA